MAADVRDGKVSAEAVPITVAPATGNSKRRHASWRRRAKTLVAMLATRNEMSDFQNQRDRTVAENCST